MYAQSPTLDAETIAEILFASTCWFAVTGMVAWVVGQLLFSPLTQKTLLFEVNSRYRLSDLIILAIHLQLAIGVVLLVIPRRESDVAFAICTYLALLLSWLWLLSVRMLANAGIENTQHRWLLLGVVMPVGYVAGLVLTSGIVMVPMAVGLLLSAIFGDNEEWLLGVVGILLVFAGACGCSAVCRRMTWMAVERARRDRAERDGIEFGESASPFGKVGTAASTDVRADGVMWVDEQSVE